MRKSNRNIALVLDNCTAHPKVEGLTNIKLIFLPPNTTARTKPMDAGVIRCLKSHYQKNIAKMRLVAFEEKKDYEQCFRRNKTSQQCLECGQRSNNKKLLQKGPLSPSKRQPSLRTNRR